MGGQEAKLKERFLFSIVANREGDCANFLKKYPDFVNTPLVENMTNPICRAAFLGHQNIAALLLKHGADVNLRSSEGRTPVIWAAFRNNHKMIEFLVANGGNIELEDNAGWNALDMAIIKMNYEAALILKKFGLKPRDPQMYLPNLWQKYDIDLFISYLEEDREEVDYNRFFDLIKKQEEEWRSKDLVVDVREGWKKWAWRQMNFEDPPLIPREELPQQFQPHRSFYGKVACFMNGIDPYPPRPIQEVGNPLDASGSSFAANQPLKGQSQGTSNAYVGRVQIVTDGALKQDEDEDEEDEDEKEEQDEQEEQLEYGQEQEQEQEQEEEEDHHIEAAINGDQIEVKVEIEGK